MTKLPTAADVIGRVQPTSAPRVTVPRDAFPDYTDVTRELTAEVDSFLIAEKKKNDETEAQDLSNQFNTKARQLLIGNEKDPGDPDYEPGYKSYMGKTALERRAEYEKKLEDFRKELLTRTTNNTVRRTLNRALDARTAQFQTSTGTHFNDQRKEYRKTTFEATNAEATESAIADHLDPSHIDDIYNNTFKYYSDQGFSPKAAQSIAEEQRSKAIASVIFSLSGTDAKAAQEYMDAQSKAGRIDLDVLAAVKTKVKTSLMRNASMEKTAEIFAKYPNHADAIKRLDEAQKIPNEEIREATIKRIGARDYRTKTAMEISRKSQYEANLKAITQDGKDPADLDTSNLSVTETNNLNKAHQARMNANAGFGKADDPTALEAIHKAMERNEDMRVFALETLKKKLTRKTYDKYFLHRSQLLAKDQQAIADGKIYGLGNTEADKTVDRMKLDSKKATALKGALKTSLKDFVDEYREEHDGRYPNRELIKRHIAKQTLTVDFGLFSTQRDEMRVFAEQRMKPFSIENYDEPVVQKQIADATGYRPQDVAKIISALERYRRPITIDNITRVYDLSRRAALNEEVDD